MLDRKLFQSNEVILKNLTII